MSFLVPQLEAFMKVVEHKTVYAAAEKLHITPTAVTQRIRNLEKNLGTTLFVRTRKGMRMTAESGTLLHFCQIVNELEDEMLSKIKGAAIKSEINIAIAGPTSIMHSRIVPQCMPVMNKFPNLLFDYIIDNAEKGHLSLKAGTCDFAILRKEYVLPEMKTKELEPEQYILVGSPAWEGRKTKDIVKNERIIDFGEHDQITYNYLREFGLFDIAQHRRHFAARPADLAQLAAGGFGYTSLAIAIAKPYIERHQLIALNQGEMLSYFPVLAWYNRPEPPKYFSAIINAIK